MGQKCLKQLLLDNRQHRLQESHFTYNDINRVNIYRQIYNAKTEETILISDVVDLRTMIFIFLE